MKRFVPALGRSLFGVLCCAAAALLAALVAVNRPWRGLVPIAFVFAIVLLASRYGMAVAVFGSITAALIFAWFLFPPLGSLQVSDTRERSNLGWMLLGSVAVSYLILPPPASVEAEKSERK